MLTLSAGFPKSFLLFHLEGMCNSYYIVELERLYHSKIHGYCFRSDCTTSTDSDELRLLRDTLRLSIPVVNLDSTQLSVQLLSRLMSYIMDGEAER